MQTRTTQKSRQLRCKRSCGLRIISTSKSDTTIWRFELYNTAPGAAIPGGFKLKLLTENLQPFSNNGDIATTTIEQLFVEVIL
ncbi:DUF1822 family protein [Chlorogloeopsis sp. ULAP01]|uniref:DUF1822 family protein n=1 Tax=Chlorogloeopsis sp. ULAP01 TaxID=3056483 RepID=UPI0025AAD4AE|nr:DUF1822 family protein [Chlorogloeopsis sp. ULAP01]MDM9381133.1 DUF1822 family protein [Chlorogloeopsis sp. ULAP01]